MTHSTLPHRLVATLLAVFLCHPTIAVAADPLPPDPPAATEPAEEEAGPAPDPSRAAAERAAAAPETAPAGASTVAGRGPIRASVIDPNAVFTIPAVPKPSYLVSTIDPVFGTTIMRVTGNTGGATSPVSGNWGTDSRHKYSKTQPWNSTGTMFWNENRGASPGNMILDGTTFEPIKALCSGLYDMRWHPSPARPNVMMSVNSSGTQLSWVDVTNCQTIRSWTLPITVDYGIGSGEGNPSNDGRFVALASLRQVFVVDMDPQTPYASYPNKRIGPVYTMPVCSLGTGIDCDIDNVTVSASGKYVIVKYGNTADTTKDIERVLSVDPATLELKIHNMASNSLRPGSWQYRPNGWIYPLKHHDVALDPFDNNEDVALGGNSPPGSSLGRVLKVRLRDGKVTELTDRDNEASFLHTSARNLDRPGWVYVNYYRQPGKRFSDEIVAVKMDGSRTVERLAHMHSSTSGCYRCEQHPVPSRDGSRVIFASNWTVDCGNGCGSASDIKDYIVYGASTVGITDDPPAGGGTHLDLPGGGLQLEVLSGNPSFGLPTIAYRLAGNEPAHVDLIDVAGRAVWRRDLAPAAGRVEMRLGEDRPAAGVYWLRLSQGSASTRSKLVILH